MRVVHVADSVSRLAGGMFESVKGLCHGLVEQDGLSLAVYTGMDAYSAVDREAWGAIDVRPCAVNGLYNLVTGTALGKILLSDKIDILHVHGIWGVASRAAAYWRMKSNTPYVVSLRGMLDGWALQRSRSKKRVSYAIWERSVLKHAACLHALNESEKRAIREYGLTNPICVVPNGVEIPNLYPPGKQDGDKRALLFLGRLHPKKGLEELLRAWAKVDRKVRESWILKIGGWDEVGLKRHLVALLGPLGIDRDVDFVGPVFGAEKEALFRSSSAFILPSHSEGLPMSVLEAWAYGLPVFMTRHCNLRKGFAENAAFEIDVEPADMAAVLERFLCDEAAREAAARNGRKLVERDHTWGAISNEMLGIYRRYVA